MLPWASLAPVNWMSTQPLREFFLITALKRVLVFYCFRKISYKRACRCVGVDVGVCTLMNVCM